MKAGASIHKQTSGISRSLDIWLRHHAQALIFSLRQLVKNPIASFLTIAVIGVSLSLPAGFYLLLENAGQITKNWGTSAQITIFLKHDLDDSNIPALINALSEHPDIENIELIDRDAALAEYKQYSGFSEALAVLEDNPLPAVLLLRPDYSAISSGHGTQILDYLRTFNEIETAQYDGHWVNRLSAIIEIFRRAIIMFSALLGFAVLLIVGNTIRLSIYNSRSEIEINKLFGATDGFIRRPFLYSGLIHGFGGSFMAWLLLLLAIKLLEQPVLSLAGMYASDFTLANLAGREMLILFVSGGFLGLMGSWFAFQRHVKTLDLD